MRVLCVLFLLAWQLKEAGLEANVSSTKQQTTEEEGDTTANEDISDDEADVMRPEAQDEKGKNITYYIIYTYAIEHQAIVGRLVVHVLFVQLQLTMHTKRIMLRQ